MALDRSGDGPVAVAQPEIASASQVPVLDMAQISVRNIDGTIRLWTRGMERLYGYSSAEAVGRRFHDLLRTEYPEPLPDIIARLREIGVWSGELHQTDRDGRNLIVESHWSLGRDHLSGEEVVSEFDCDVTALREASNRTALLADVVKSSDDAIIIKSLSSLIISVNPAAERLFQYSAAELVGQSILILFPSDRVEEESVFLDRIKRGEQIEHFESVRRRRDGTLIEASISISPVHNEAGRIVGAATITREISERNRERRRIQDLQASLAHLNRVGTMSHMTSALAHELNQPLAALSNYLFAARRITAQHEGLDQLGLAIDKAQKQLTRASDVVAQLRSFVRRGETERRPTSINEVVRDGVELGALDAVRKRVNVRLQLDEAVGVASVDPVQVSQVVVNLVRNAVEAMQGRQSRQLTVTTSVVGGYVEITVGDTGPGISPDVRDKIFQPFTTTKLGGMGLGLPISRQLVEAHGGQLERADRPGGGTVFTIRLPR